MTRRTKKEQQQVNDQFAEQLKAENAQETTPGGALRANVGKVNWALLPMQFLIGAVRVLMKGAIKYEKHNWRKGMPYSEAYNSLQRHLVKFQMGEDLDLVDDDGKPGTGEHHLDCALVNLIFLRSYVMEHPHLDDRYGKPTAEEREIIRRAIYAD